VTGEKEHKITIRTYASIWNIQTKIYSIDNIKLIVPVSIWNVLYYMIGFVIITAVDHVVNVPGFIRFGLFPMFFVFVLTKVKLDGKKPHKFFIGLFRYILNPKEYEFFRAKTNNQLKGFNDKVYFRRSKGGITVDKQ
jgi:hypothetical protein